MLFAGLAFASITMSFDSQFSSERTQLDAKFDAAYTSSLAAFSYLGEEGFKVRWMDDYETEDLGCGEYEECAYIEVATIENCIGPVRFEFSLLDKNDNVLFQESVTGEIMKSGAIQRILVGTHWFKSFANYLPENITCKDEEIAL